MKPITYTIGIDVPHPKEAVWKAITDVAAYPTWNSVLEMTHNDQWEIGKSFHVSIHQHGKKTQFKAKLLAKEPLRYFSARQTMLGSWFFSATHFFILEEQGAQLRFVQTWHLTGLVSRLFKKLIFRQLAEFKVMNEELKQYLEGKQSA